MENYQVFNRHEWAQLHTNLPLLLSETDLAELSGINEPVSLDDLREVFLPLSYLLQLYVSSAQQLRHRVQQDFFNKTPKKIPFIIGIAGSVAVGKTTFARVLQKMLSSWEQQPRVALVPTDGFLYSNAELEQDNLMDRKGFPQSYDVVKMIDFLIAAKAGEPQLTYPTYSHETYDILADQQQTINSPDILIIEGLNVLQSVANVSSMASDYFDFSIYIDADEDCIEQWYIERFFALQKTVFSNPNSFFHRFKDLAPADAKLFAAAVWQEINLVNLRENIAPSKQRARLIVHKNPAHQIEKLSLRHF